jgi:HlyD family secretion protein
LRAEADVGGKKNAQHPQPSLPDAKLPADASRQKTEQKSPDSKDAPPTAPDQHAGEPAPAPAADKKVTGKRIMLAIILLAVIAVGGYVIWKVFFAVPPVPASIVILSGRIEGDDSAVAVKPTGRILEVRVREGDRVKTGDIIAVLDDQQIRDREDQAQGQSNVDAQGRVRQAEADLAASEADEAQQEAAYEIAAFDRDAYTALAKTGAVSERQGKQSVSTAGQQAAAVAAAKRRVEASNGALTTARANLSNPGIKGEQVLMVRRQIAQQQAEIASAMANTKHSRFQLSEAQANRSDLIVRAPFDGTVITRSAEPGEVVPAGAAIISLLDLSKVYLRGFVPEGNIGKVKAGQLAHIYLDSNPKQAVDAYVTRIDPESTFTPENTYFKDDRVKQVVGVKLQLKGATGFAKPGMPADGEILTEGTVWPDRNKRQAKQ